MLERGTLRTVPVVLVSAVVYLLLLALPLFAIAPEERLILDPALLLFFCLACLFFLADVPAALRGPASDFGGPRIDGALARLVTRMASLSILAVFWLSLGQRLIETESAAALELDRLASFGGAVMALGCLIRFAAIRSLGEYFADGISVRLGQDLIQDGIYSLVRHPSEVGNLFVVFGASILLESRSGVLLALCLFVPLVLLRITIEDRYLARRFPREFKRYSKRVQALVPYIF